MKEQFLKNEIWTLTFGAAFQRANVYLMGANEDEKQNFKVKTREFIEKKLAPQYIKDIVSDKKHINNIDSLSNFTAVSKTILNGGKLNFGVSQKLLNLYLKYLWCLDEITTPPHFPVDRRIQELLKIYPINAWTQFEDSIAYMHVINTGRNKIENYKSIAELELHLFERRVKTETK